MKAPRRPQLVPRIFEALFAITVAAYPRRFRRRFGDSMLGAFRDGFEHRRDSEDGGATAWALRTVVTSAMACSTRPWPTCAAVCG